MKRYKYYLLYKDKEQSFAITDLTTYLNSDEQLARLYFKGIRSYLLTNEEQKQIIKDTYKDLKNPNINVYLICDKQILQDGRVISSKVFKHYRLFTGKQFIYPKGV